MTIADLIKELQGLNPDTEVWGNSSVAGECGPLSNSPFYNGKVIQFSNTHGNETYQYWVTEKDSAGLSGVNNKDVLIVDLV